MTILVETRSEKLLKIKIYDAQNFKSEYILINFIERRVAREAVEPTTFDTK
jgi:hypothetical protein